VNLIIPVPRLQSLRKLGYEIVLVNSNPATIMTDPGTADVTYIEPLNVQSMIEIIENEKPTPSSQSRGTNGLNLTANWQSWASWKNTAFR